MKKINGIILLCIRRVSCHAWGGKGTYNVYREIYSVPKDRKKTTRLWRIFGNASLKTILFLCFNLIRYDAERL